MTPVQAVSPLRGFALWKHHFGRTQAALFGRSQDWAKALRGRRAAVLAFVAGISLMYFMFRLSCPCYGRQQPAQADCAGQPDKGQKPGGVVVTKHETSTKAPEDATPSKSQPGGKQEKAPGSKSAADKRNAAQDRDAESKHGSRKLSPEELTERVAEAMKSLGDKAGGALDPLELAQLAATRKGKQVGQLIVAITASHEQSDLLRNCVKSLKRVGLGPLVLVAALDKSIMRMCQENKLKAVPLYAVGGDQVLPNVALPSDDPAENVRTMQLPRLLLLLELLKLKREVLLVDVDSVFLRSPLNSIRKDGLYPDADIAIVSETLSWENSEQGMKAKVAGGMRVDKFAYSTPRAGEPYGSVYTSTFNSGLMLAMPTNATLLTVHAWIAALHTQGRALGWAAEDAADEKEVFNKLARTGGAYRLVGDTSPGSKPANPRLFWAFEQRLKLGVLSPSYFVNGHIFFVQRLPQTLRKRPVAVHNSFQFFGTVGKIWRLREGHLWSLDAPSHFNKGNFLSFDTALPEDVLSGIQNPIDKHIATVSFYYLSIRNALAIASILNRTLILPSVACYCDKFWWSLSRPCRMPGVDEDPPYNPCPMDHMLNVASWGASAFPFREHSFLQNPEVSGTIKNSKKTISVVSRPSQGPTSAQTLPKDSIPTNALDFEIHKLLGRFSKIRVLHLETAADAFCRHKSQDKDTEFDAKTLGAGLFDEEWCCEPWKEEWGEETKESLKYRRFKAPKPLAGTKLADCQKDPIIALELD